MSDDPDLGEIVEMFVDEMPERVAALEGSLKARDWEQLGRLAHQLKGACVSYGFHQMTPLAATLEAACRTQQPSEAEILVAAAELIGTCLRARTGSSH
ncbi:MAG: Hpt domain-containing protein [Pirellulaceae bacterium]